MRTHLLILSAAVFVAGCGTYSEDFDCAPGVGVGCKSLSSINQMVEEGKLPKAIDTNNTSESVISKESGPIHIWFSGYRDEHGRPVEPSQLTVDAHHD